MKNALRHNHHGCRLSIQTRFDILAAAFQIPIFISRITKANMQTKILGLSLSLGVPVLFVLLLRPMVIEPNVREPIGSLVGLSVLWVVTFAVLIVTRKVEDRSLATIGWKSISWKSALIAIGCGVLLSLLVPVLTLLARTVLLPSDSRTIATVVSDYPWWMVLLSTITAGVTEEILFRGYALERLLEVTGNKWISGITSLVCFIAVHLAGWNIAHIIGVVIPLGTVLTGLYFWQRNVIFLIIVHIAIDLPLVIMALHA